MNSFSMSAMLFLATALFGVLLSGCASIGKNTNAILVQQEANKMEIVGKAALTARSSNNRMSNMALACSAINNHIVNQGEIFSFNSVVGKRTTQRGYKIAPINVNKKKAMGIGGGICQVSSALYNAVKDNPNIAIVERHRHSKKVSYTQHDATVSFGSKDLKFKNNYDVPIVIKAMAEDDTVQVEIYK